MKHTEGDWEITKVGYPKDKEFWITANQNVIAKIANIPTGDKQPEANARLIAAAPKLLDACKAAKAILNTHSGHSCYTDKQQESYSKALRKIEVVIAEVEKG